MSWLNFLYFSLAVTFLILAIGLWHDVAAGAEVTVGVLLGGAFVAFIPIANVLILLYLLRVMVLPAIGRKLGRIFSIVVIRGKRY